MAKYKISGVPIVDENNILIGIITNRDIKFETDMSRKIEEAMTTQEHLVTAKEGVTFDKENGSTITPLSLLLTLSTSEACSSIDMFLWIIPIPPCLAIDMAIFDINFYKKLHNMD